jgi:hypothetical protein
VSPLKANVYIKDEMMTLKCYILHEKGGWVGGGILLQLFQCVFTAFPYMVYASADNHAWSSLLY